MRKFSFRIRIIESNDELVATTTKFLLKIFAGLLVVLVVIAGIGSFAISQGPVSIGFLFPYIDDILKSKYPGQKIEFSDIVLEWKNDDHELHVRAKDILITLNDKKVAAIPDMSAKFSGEAMLVGRLAPSELEFYGLRILLKRLTDGRFDVGYSTDDPLAGQTAVAEDYFIDMVIDRLMDAPDKQHLTGYLKRIELFDSNIRFNDQVTGKLWHANAKALVFARTDAGIQGSMAVAVELDGQIVDLDADISFDRESRQIVASAAVAELFLPLLATQHEKLDILKHIDLAVSAEVDVAMNETFDITYLSFSARTQGGSFFHPDLYKKPVNVNAAEIEGTVSGDFKKFSLSKVNVAFGKTKVTAHGELELSDKGLGLKVSGNLNEFKTNDLEDFWPHTMAVDGYNWVTKSIRQGIVTNGTFDIDLPVGAIESGNIPDQAIRLAFDFNGLSTNYYPPLPPVTNIRGSGVLTEKQIKLTGMTGEVDGLPVTEGEALISGFHLKDQTADIGLVVSGDNQKIMIFLDRKPLEFVSLFGIDPLRVQGSGAVRAKFNFPLLDSLELQDVNFAAAASMENTTIPDAVDEVDLTEGSLILEVNPEGLTLKGTASLDEIPSTISMQTWFKGKRKSVRTYHVEAVLEEEHRKKIGLDNEYLKGPVSIVTDVVDRGDGALQGTLSVDLTNAQLQISELKWLKDFQAPGNLSTSFAVDKNNNINLDNTVFRTSDMLAKGSLFIENKRLRQLFLNEMKWGASDFTASYIDDGAGKVAIRLKGASFDLRRFVDDLDELDAPDKEPSSQIYNIEAQFARVILNEGINITSVDAVMEIANDDLRAAEIIGQIKGGAPLRMRVKPKGDKRIFSVLSDDAGAVLSAFDITDDIRGGKLIIRAVIDDAKEEEPVRGALEMTDIKVINAPVLASILQVGSLGGIVDLLSGEGASFTRVDAPFEYVGNVITLKDFRAVGSVGLTMNGTIDRNTGKIDAFGTVIPSYTLNSVLGNIPILGRLLVGRKGEGIFGFSYKVKGTREKPEVSVNPLSALAPGILRRMFFEPFEGDNQGSTEDILKEYPDEDFK